MEKFDYLDLAKLYVFGEKLVDSTFQDCIINAIVARSRREDKDGNFWFPGEETVSVIYRNTTPASPGRHLLVNFFVNKGEPEWMIEISTVYEREFLLDLAKTFLHLKEKSEYDKEARAQIEIGVPCAYHKHAMDKPCKAEVMTTLLED